MAYAADSLDFIPSSAEVLDSQIFRDIDTNSGSYNYGYPIAVPPGRNGMQANVSLNYNSQQNNNQNIYGYGWNDSIPYIQRNNTDGVDQLYRDNTFTSSLVGELTEKGTSTKSQAMAMGDGLGGGIRARFAGIQVYSPQYLIFLGEAYKDKDGATKFFTPKERKDLRTTHSKTWLEGYTKDGETIYSSKIYTGAAHYWAQGVKQYEDIDTSLKNTANGWGMSAAKYGVRLKNDLKSDKAVIFKNGANDLALSVTRDNPATPVTGNVDRDPNKDWKDKTAKYPNAVRNGIDLNIKLSNEALIKELVIQDLSALGNLKNKETVEFSFEVESNKHIRLFVGRDQVNNGETFTTKLPARIIDSEGTITQIFAPRAYDVSTSSYQSIAIDIEYRKIDDKTIRLTKKLPVAWLQSAEYPVRTDAIISPYSHTQGDGNMMSGAPWDTAHDNYTSYVDRTSASAYAAWVYNDGAGKHYIYRSSFPFDTTSLPADAEVVNAALHLHMKGQVAEDDDEAYIAVLQSFQASSTYLDPSDYCDVGSDNGNACRAKYTPQQLGSDKVYLNTIPTSYQHVGIALNATGTAWVSTSTWTYVGLREGHDIEDTQTTVQWGNNGVQAYFSDEAGTDKDPYLEVEYSTAYTPDAPTSLLVEGMSNGNTTDPAPEFTAIFDDPDTNDTAPYYQIQVATSTQGFLWGGMVWDSGKTLLPANLDEGDRSEGIEFRGDPLALDGTKYYWRIKFWDDDTNEGIWSSGNDYFTMEEYADFGAKVESGNALHFRYEGESWTVKDKVGTVYTFGTAANARQDSASGDKTYKWMLSETRDANDNYVKYEYFKDGGQIYPSKITYTGHGTTDGDFEVAFTRESRTDTATSTNAGFNVLSNHRISEIQVKEGITWVRKYELDYTTGDNGSRSLLSSITETGKDSEGTQVSLPATEFTYAKASGQEGWAEDTNWSVPDVFAIKGLSAGTRMMDANGDGLQDIVRSHFNQWNEETTKKVYLNDGDGSGWTYDSARKIPRVFINRRNAECDCSVYDWGIRQADINGDGFTDLLEGANSNRSIHLGDGTSWATSTNINLPISFVNPYDDGIRLSDVNGDGLIDILVSRKEIHTFETFYRNKVYINTGNGWILDEGWYIPEVFIERDSNLPPTPKVTDLGVRLADINGDSLPDILKAYYDGSTTVKRVYLNNGTGWTEVSGWSMPDVLTQSNLGDAGIRLVDVNSDGLLDWVQSRYAGSGQYTKKVYLNKGDGTGWTTEETNWDIPKDFAQGTSETDSGTRLTDVDGDTVVDLVHGYGGGTSTTTAVYINKHGKKDILVGIENGRGGETTLGYKGSPQYADGSGNLLNKDLSLTLNTLTSVTTNDGNGNLATTTYEYGGGGYYYVDADHKKFAGFATTTKTDAEGNVTKTYHHQGNGTNSSLGEYSDHESKIGKTYRTEMYDDDDNLYSKVISKWENYDLNDDRDFVKTTQTINSTYDGDTDHKDNAETILYDDANGNVIGKIEWGEVTGSDNGTFTDTGTDKASTTVSYAASTTQYLIGLPSQEIVYDQSQNKVAETKYYYDDLSAGNVAKGNQTKREFWKSASNYISEQNAYNTYGLVTQSIDPRGATTTYVYDPRNIYPATTTNTLGHKVEQYYDYSSGQVTKLVDQNGNAFESVYDGLDRITEEKQPDIATSTTLVTKAKYVYTDTIGQRKVKESRYLTETNIGDSYTYVDGFDRSIQVRVEAEGSNYSIVDSIYNKLGQVAKTSLPYFGTGTAKTAATTDADLYSVYTYDPVQRVETVANTVGTTTSAYDDWKTTVTDASGNAKSLYSDARGNLVKVEENNATSTYTTQYIYNLLGNLTKITDASSNIRNFTYDALGRRLTAEDLHDANDTTYYGTWNYTYDDAGNTTRVVDPESQTIDYTYDDIGRVLTEDYTADSGTEGTYGYDWCAEGEGKLCSATTTDGTVSEYAYNALGLTDSETKTIASSTYTTQYNYDRQGNITLLTYPDDAEVKYTYNNAGQPEKVEKKESGESIFSGVVDDFDYGPHGKVTFKSFSNGTESTYTYDTEELYRLQNILTEKEGGVGGSLEDLTISEPVLLALASDTTTQTVGKKATPFQGKTEQKEKRTPKAKTFVTGQTSEGYDIYTTEVHKNDIHYFDTETRRLENIDTSLVDTADSWKMEKAPYRVKLKKNTAEDVFTFFNKRDDITIGLAHKDKKSVNGKLLKKSGEGDSVLYKDAFGKGIDLVVTPATTLLRKEAVIENKKALGDLTGKEYYELPFKLSSKFNLELSADGKVLTPENPITTKGTVTLTDSIGTETYIWTPRAEQARHGRSIPIEIRYEKKHDGIYMTKLLPVAWLEAAEYPVRTDATVSYYANASGDGEIYNGDSSVWSTVHDSTSGTEDDTSSTAYTYTEYYGSGDFWQARVALPFDTSGLPDNATISSANLKVYVNSVGDDDNDGDDFIRVVQNTTAAVTSLDSGDYDQIGSVDNPTAGASDTDITGITNNQYLTIALNSTGLGWISKTGYTKLGLREGHDAKDTPPAGNGLTGIRIATADTSGTSQDPYLEITYSIITNSAPTAPTSLLTEAATNPTEVTDTTPEFSAIYNDPDSGDTAEDYRIQVSTSQSDWTSPVWDSNKTSMTATTEGNRSLDISYGGTALDLDGTTYYWRIKFWDDDDAEGAWSSTSASFTMKNNVSTSTTVTYYSASGGDGEIYHGGSSVWSTIHDATSGTADDTSSTAYVYSEYYGGGGDFWQARVALPFDTSGLPDSATIATATLYVYVDTKSDADNDGDDFIRVIQNTTASETSLANGDWDEIGAVDNSTAGASDTDITGISTGGYLAIPLNTTGVGWISKTGYTKLGLREGHDAKDTPPAGNGLTGVRIHTADYTGTSRDPYIEISYTTGSPSQPLAVDTIQDISFTYDDVGNITQIVDNSETNARATTTYGYDDLYRLISASTTGATTSSYSRTYAYSSIGNITTKSDQGAYLYEGDTGTNYANPHAVTKVGAVIYSYDKNGNLTGEGTWTHTWDYNNRLSQSSKTGKTVTYGYDHTTQRVSYSDGTNTTIYPNKWYNKKGSVETKHVYAGGDLVATVEDDATNTIHTDHLGGTNAATNEDGDVVQTLSYYPFGDQRVSDTYSSFDEKRKFTGHEYDDDTELTYANARYYGQAIGRWMSQDPAFLAVGTSDLADIVRSQEDDENTRDKAALREYLSNPQNLNSYSYVNNNPLKYNDPEGKFLKKLVAKYGGGAVGAVLGGVVGGITEYVSDVASREGAGRFVPELDTGTAIVKGVSTGFAAGELTGKALLAIPTVFVIEYSFGFGETQDFSDAFNIAVEETAEHVGTQYLESMGDIFPAIVDSSIDVSQETYRDQSAH